jgi:3-oxoacyl-(acyl-carrier-protein) synthase
MPRNDASRVVVTGLGCVTTLGESSDALMDALLAGRSGVTRWKSQPSTLYSKIGGELSDFKIEQHTAAWPAHLAETAHSVLRISPPAGRYVAASVYQALATANALDVCDAQTGHLLATHNVNERFVFQQALEFAEEPDFVDPMYGVIAFDTDPLASANEIFGVRGPSFTVGGACASSNVALLTALDLLRAGRAKRVIVSGCAGTLSPMALQGWSFIDALTLDTFADEPHRASRPFDKRREGFVPSEGAGAVVLETLEEARRRKAPIRAEILGGAMTSAASRGTRTDIDAQKRAIRAALQDSQIQADQIDYVNSHGTSTPIGDLNEMVALRAILGDHVRRIPINSTKSMLGHTLQASNLLELIATIGQMERGRVHQTLNLDDVDPDFADLDLVPGTARDQRINVALSNGFGFGGVNAVIAVARL